MTRTSRGLLGTTRLVPKRLDTEQAALNAIAKMEKAPAFGPQWKERREWALGLARGGFDWYGRRLMTEKGIQKAQYVARVSYRAHKKGVLPEGRSRTIFDNSITAIYRDLGGGQ